MGIKGKKIHICIWGGWYGSRNAGDSAILTALIRVFNEKFDTKPEITVFARNAPYIKAEYGVHAFSPIKEIPQIVQSLWRSDIFLIGGGTPFFDGAYHQLTLLFYFLWAKIFLKKIMVYAVSSQNIQTGLGRFVIPLVLNNVSLITVREPETKRIFEGLGVKKSIVLTTDPALLLPLPQPKRIDEIFLREGIPFGSKPLIGICPRLISDHNSSKFYHRPFTKNETANYKQVLAKIADKLADRANLVFIPLHTEEPHSDNTIIEEIIELIKNRRNVYAIRHQYKAQDILGIISWVDMLIGARFHSLVFGAAVGIPAVAISYGPKTKGFIEAIKQSSYICELQTLTFDDISKKIDSVLLNKDAIKKELQSSITALKGEAIANVERMMSLL